MTPTQFKTSRLAMGLTQQALAEETGINQGKISNYETGRRDVPPYIANLMKLKEDAMTKAQKIERLRRATLEITKEKGGKFFSSPPSHSPDDMRRAGIWTMCNHTYISLANQIHSGFSSSS